MYKFSRCHAVIFHGFFVPFTDFRQNSPGFWQNSPGNHHTDFQAELAISQWNRLHFSLPSFHYSSIISGAFWPNFPEFHWFFSNFAKTGGIGEVRFSSFRWFFEHWAEQVWVLDKAICFLGPHHLEGGISVDPSKVQDALSWNAPTMVGDIQSFLGLAEYYQRIFEDKRSQDRVAQEG
jgi:hypothetical protein